MSKTHSFLPVFFFETICVRRSWVAVVDGRPARRALLQSWGRRLTWQAQRRSGGWGPLPLPPLPPPPAYISVCWMASAKCPKHTACLPVFFLNAFVCGACGWQLWLAGQPGKRYPNIRAEGCHASATTFRRKILNDIQIYVNFVLSPARGRV